MSGVQPVITQNGAPFLVATGIVQNARTITPVNVPKKVPRKWVAHCVNVGRGTEVLKYLSRYLYRGVISEKNIVLNKNGQVMFKYVESKTGGIKFRTLPGEEFLHLVVQHVLPKGFRRVRDYGFLHSNAKKLLSLVQLILHVIIEELKPRPRPVFKCPCCKAPMLIFEFRRNIRRPG